MFAHTCTSMCGDLPSGVKRCGVLHTVSRKCSFELKFLPVRAVMRDKLTQTLVRALAKFLLHVLLIAHLLQDLFRTLANCSVVCGRLARTIFNYLCVGRIRDIVDLLARLLRVIDPEPKSSRRFSNCRSQDRKPFLPSRCSASKNAAQLRLGSKRKERVTC